MQQSDSQVHNPGRLVRVHDTNEPTLAAFVGKVFRILTSSDVGIIAQPDGGGELVFFEFNGATGFDLDPQGNFAFAPAAADSSVYDLGNHGALGDFLSHDTRIINEAIAISTSPAPVFAAPVVGSVAAPAPAVSEPPWWAVFSRGTIFVVDQTDNQAYKYCQGVLFKAVEVSEQGILAVARCGSGLGRGTVWLPFDGNTTFTTNPPEWQGLVVEFPNLDRDVEVYDVVTHSYFPVVSFYVDFFPLVPFAPVIWF